MTASGTLCQRPASGVLSLVPRIMAGIFAMPVVAGLIATTLLAFGYFPAIGGETLHFTPWRELGAAPGLMRASLLSLLSGLLATALALGLAILLAAYTEARGWLRWSEGPLALLVAIPHAAFALGLAFLFAPAGLLMRWLLPLWPGSTLPSYAFPQDAWALSLATGLAAKEVPFFFLMILSALARLGLGSQIRLARTLGYRPLALWIKILLPQLYPVLRLPVYAVLAFAMTVTDMAILLGPATPPTLPVLLLQWFQDAELSKRFQAAAGALLLVGLIILAIGIWEAAIYWIARRFRHCLSNGRRGHALGLNIIGPCLGVSLLAIGTLIFVSLAVLSLAQGWSFPSPFPKVWTLERWQIYDHDLITLSLTSFGIGLMAAFIAVVLTLASLEQERRRQIPANIWMESLLYLPLLLPPISVLMGFQTLLIWLHADGTYLAVLWSHLLFCIPYSVIALAPSYRNQDLRYHRAAMLMGASQNRIFWRITLPLLKRPIAIAFALAFAVSSAQYLPTLFAGNGQVATLTTEAVALAAGGDRAYAAAAALLQALLPLIMLAIALYGWPVRQPQGWRFWKSKG